MEREYLQNLLYDALRHAREIIVADGTMTAVGTVVCFIGPDEMSVPAE
jgi:hypothetical protein